MSTYYFDRLEEAKDAEYVVFIGYDPLEDQCAKMLAHSIRSKTTMDLKIIPIVRDELLAYGIFERPVDPNGSTQFSITRFMVPTLMGFTGIGIFFDCDMLITRDIHEMFNLYDSNYAVQCVRHDYIPKADPKMGGKPQSTYPRKNWSSAVIYNCAHPSNSVLTKGSVEQSTPQFLHRFEWLEDSEIGALPIEFNFLVEEYELAKSMPFNLHHTLGPMIYREKLYADYSEYWKAQYHHTFGKPFDPDIDCVG